MTTALSVEQETEIGLAWKELAKQYLLPLVGQPLSQLTLSTIDYLAKNIGRELTQQFYDYLMFDEQVEVTVGVDESHGIVAGWRIVKQSSPFKPSLPEVEEVP